MLDLRSLKILLWAKRRRLAPLEQQVQIAADALAVAVSTLERTRQLEAACRAEQAGCLAKINNLGSDGGFRPDEAVTLSHVLQGLTDLTRQAVDAVATATGACADAELRLQDARRTLQRANQQIEQLEERRVQRLKQIDQEGEDVQDEESEEAAVARRVAQSREIAALAAQATQRAGARR